MKPAVSVIIPTYNRRHVLRESVESVLNQSYGDLEVIIIDDGSTDGTQGMVRGWTAWKNVRFIQASHGGPAAARNIGLEAAQGRFVALCDSDDLWLPGKLEAQMAYFDEHPGTGMVYTDAMSFRDDQILVNSYFSERAPASGRVLDALLERNFIPNQSVVARKDSVDKVGRFHDDIHVSEDYEYWLRFAAFFDIGYIDRPLVKIRRAGDNFTHDNQAAYIRHLAALEIAAKKLGPLFPKKALRGACASTYRHMGYDHLVSRRFRESRRTFRDSLRQQPFSSATWRYFVVSLLPAGVLNALLDRRLQAGSHEREALGAAA